MEALVTEEPSRLAPTAGVEAAGTPGTERLILRYLQEAGTVRLLTAADEVRVAEQWQSATAHLQAALQAARPAAAIPPELTPEAWVAAQLRQRQRWVARLDPGAGRGRRSRQPPAALRHLWATLQPWHERLEAAKTAMVTAGQAALVRILGPRPARAEEKLD